MLVALCLQAVGQSEFCLEGTVWDDVLQGCVPNNPSDLNQDGCVGLDDFLNHLAAYGEGCVDAVVETSWECGNPLEYQGYDYETVQIGEQCWFAENLRSGTYQNGDAIPSSLNDNDWKWTTSGALALYGEDFGCESYSPDFDACDPTQSLNEYGRLYNWHAVDDARGLCPNGWHVPSDSEWTIMTDEIGGPYHAPLRMKTTYGWYDEGNGTNLSGFSGLPGGLRHYDEGAFAHAGQFAWFWSSTPHDYFSWYRALSWATGLIERHYGYRENGFSVRCLKDVE